MAAPARRPSLSGERTSVTRFAKLATAAAVATFVLIAVGGLLYTCGAIVYGLKRPDPWPQVFGFHEVFHLCTVVAATCHMVAVWLAVY